ncbi:MAG: hypothetical protein RJA63_3532, partial [Pseudomonadota bacterium]
MERPTLPDSVCQPPCVATGASPQAVRIWQLVDFIDAHLSDAFSVDQLAAEIGL